MVVVNSVELGFRCSRDFCVVCVIQNELLEWFISPCELILGDIVVN